MATLSFADITVPCPGFGAMGLSAFYGSTNEAESINTLKHAIEIGCTFIDTANIYGCGHNEELIGSVVKETGCRNKVFIATKFGSAQFDAKTRNFLGGPRGDATYVKQMLTDSINRLGFTPDLYYQHRVDPDTSIEETVKAMDEERKAGRCKYIGLSECSAETLRKACKVAKIDALQVEYSLWTTDIERNGIKDAAKELGVAIIAYSPLGRGFLAGRFEKPEDIEEGDYRKNNPRFVKEAFEANMKIVDELKKLANAKKCTPGQLCLAWCISQGTIPIPGTKSIRYLDENWASKDVSLSKDEIAEVRKLVDKVGTVGERYEPSHMKNVHI